MEKIEIKNPDRKDRIAYIDIAKGIGILLVVLGHLLPYGNVVKTAIYVIHMPLFFFVSGLVLKEYPLKDFFNKRCAQILIPYFLWAAIFASFSFKNILYILYATNETLRLAGSSGMLWFLSVMFIASLIVQLVLKVSKKNKIVIAVSIPVFLIIAILSRMVKHSFSIFLTYGLPFAFDVICLAVAFILTGWGLLPIINKMIDKIKKPLLVLISVLTIGISFLGIFLNTNKGSPQMATLDVGNIVAYYALAVVAVVGVVLISTLLDKCIYIKKYLVWLGKNSLTFFVTHRIFLYQCQDYYFSNPTLLVLLAMFVILMIATTAITVVVSLIFPVLTGKTKHIIFKKTKGE